MRLVMAFVQPFVKLTTTFFVRLVTPFVVPFVKPMTTSLMQLVKQLVKPSRPTWPPAYPPPPRDRPVPCIMRGCLSVPKDMLISGTAGRSTFRIHA